MRGALSEELDLLMVDEFQDTSPIQLALFLSWPGCARRPCSWGTSSRPSTVSGAAIRC